MKKALILLFLSTFSFMARSQNETIIYLVRHAEKVTTNPSDKNPILTDKGEKRAIALAKKLKKKKIATIYSTDFQRTKLTAKPLADKLTLEIKTYNTKQLKEFASSVLKENLGRKILIVGHSNTVLETIEAFGGKRPIAEINEQQYDYFFEVKVKNDGSVEIKTEHYGEPNSNNEGLQMMKNN
jgi:broad specificity phosphatase PhoE